MRRQLMCVMFAAVVMVSMVTQAKAAEETGVIRVTLDYGQEQEHFGSVTLYPVGQRCAGGYELAEIYGGGIIKTEDAQSPDLAQWLSEMAWDGEERILDTDGNADFTHLQEGLYLLTQSETVPGGEAFHPFLIPVPWEGQWEVAAFPKMRMLLTESPKTGQHPAPIIGAMVLVLSGMGLVMCAEKFRKK